MLSKKELINKILNNREVIVKDSHSHGFCFNREDAVVKVYPLVFAQGKVHDYGFAINVERYCLISINELETIL